MRNHEAEKLRGRFCKVVLVGVGLIFAVLVTILLIMIAIFWYLGGFIGPYQF